MSVDTIIRRLMAEVPKVLAAGVIDLETGMLLGVKTVDSHPQEVLDILAAATKDLFEGDNVTHIEGIFKRIRGVRSDERYFQQIMVMSQNLIHFFSRVEAEPRVVTVAVTRLDANLGLVLAKGRAIAKEERP